MIDKFMIIAFFFAQIFSSSSARLFEGGYLSVNSSRMVLSSALNSSRAMRTLPARSFSIGRVKAINGRRVVTVLPDA